MPRSEKPLVVRIKKPYVAEPVENSLAGEKTPPGTKPPPVFDVSACPSSDFVHFTPANLVRPSGFDSDIEPHREGINVKLVQKEVDGVRVFCPTCGDGWATGWREPWGNGVFYCNKDGQAINKILKGLLAMRVVIPTRRGVPACVPPKLLELVKSYAKYSVADCKRIARGLEPTGATRSPKARRSRTRVAETTEEAASEPEPTPEPKPEPEPEPKSRKTLASLIQEVKIGHPNAKDEVNAGFVHFLAIFEAAQVVGVSLE